MFTLLSATLLAALTLFQGQSGEQRPDSSAANKASKVESMEFMICNATYPDKCWTVNSKHPIVYFKMTMPRSPLKKVDASKGWFILKTHP